jgi:hypothetical protein
VWRRPATVPTRALSLGPSVVEVEGEAWPRDKIKTAFAFKDVK